MERVDFDYEISDERLLAYGRIPVLDRLKWLDELRRFTLMARAAPEVPHAGPDAASPVSGNATRPVR